MAPFCHEQLGSQKNTCERTLECMADLALPSRVLHRDLYLESADGHVLQPSRPPAVGMHPPVSAERASLLVDFVRQIPFEDECLHPIDPAVPDLVDLEVLQLQRRSCILLHGRTLHCVKVFVTCILQWLSVLCFPFPLLLAPPILCMNRYRQCYPRIDVSGEDSCTKTHCP